MKRLLTFLLLLSLLLPAGLLVAHSKSIVAMAADDKSSPTAVFLQYEDGFMPIALFQDGKSLIRYYDDTNEYFNQWYDELQAEQSNAIDSSFTQVIDALAGETFTCYDLSTLAKTKTVSFEQLRGQLYQLPTEENLFKQSVDKPIGLAVNSRDGAFPADIVYSSYTAENQQNIPSVYTNYVRRKLNVQGLFNTPVIIRELWETDLDNDGKKEAFIFASNLVPTAEEKHISPRAITAKPISQDGMGYYTYMLFYSETFFNIDFLLRPFLLSYASPFGSFQDNLYGSNDPPFSYQYDSQGDIRLLRMWLPDPTYRIEHPSFMLPFISDFNQDGLQDFIIIYTEEKEYGNMHWPQYKIYLQKDGQGLRCIGRQRLYK